MSNTHINTKTIVFSNNERKKIYIIGNGWASFHFCKNLDKSKYEPIIIAPNKKVINTPKLIDYIFNSDIDVEFDNFNADIINAKLVDIDFVNKKLVLTNNIDENLNQYSNYEIPFDLESIVLAIGSESNDFNIKGVKKHAYLLKTKADAELLRSVLLTNDIYNICVIGSGPTGVELCSAINVNYKMLINNHFVQINLIEAMTNILPSFSEQAKTAINKYLLQSKNIQIFTNMLVTEVYKDYIATKIYPIKTDVTIWTGGIKFNGYKQTQLYETLNKLLHKNNKITPRGINVNDDFSVNFNTNFINNMSINNKIYCLGDMVANKGPPTAQNAKLQAKWLANYLNKKINNQTNKIDPFTIPNNKETTKLLHLRDKIYVESPIYNGFMPQWMNIMVEHFY